MKFDLKGNKLVFQCETELFKQVREYFSCPYEGHSFMKRKNKFMPSRKYYITPTGQCEMGMFWEINKYLHECNIIAPPSCITKELSDYLGRQYDLKFYNNLKADGNTLREYQEDAVKLALKFGRGICLMGTGAGKTITTATLIENYYLNSTNKNAFKCLVVVPDLGLVTQTYNDFLSYGVSFKPTKWTGKHQPDLTSNVFVVNLGILQSKFEENKWLEHVDLLIVDECFDGKTNVLTPNGWCQIQNIKIGDIVLNYDEKNNEVKEDIVVNVFKNLTNSKGEKMYEMVFDDGTILKLTGNHKLFTDRGWVRADEITKDDNIITPNITTAKHK